jgi:hypothetical protein
MGMVFGLIDVHNFKLLNNETRDYLHECIKLDIHKKHDKKINPITPLKSAFFGVMDSRAEAVKQINEFDKQTEQEVFCILPISFGGENKSGFKLS